MIITNYVKYPCSCSCSLHRCSYLSNKDYNTFTFAACWGINEKKKNITNNSSGSGGLVRVQPSIRTAFFSFTPSAMFIGTVRCLQFINIRFKLTRLNQLKSIFHSNYRSLSQLRYLMTSTFAQEKKICSNKSMRCYPKWIDFFFANPFEISEMKKKKKIQILFIQAIWLLTYLFFVFPEKHLRIYVSESVCISTFPKWIHYKLDDAAAAPPINMKHLGKVLLLLTAANHSKLTSRPDNM